MARGWNGSNRRHELPKDWPRIRAAVLKRDAHQCQLRIPGLCTNVATDVDHIGDRNQHLPENLRAACAPCHRRRTGIQGGTSAGRAARARAAARFRKPERHPGII